MLPIFSLNNLLNFTFSIARKRKNVYNIKDINLKGKRHDRNNKRKIFKG